MFVLNKAHARAFQGRIHQKFSKGGEGAKFFQMALKSKQKKGPESSCIFKIFTKITKMYTKLSQKKKQIKRVEGGGGVKGSALD